MHSRLALGESGSFMLGTVEENAYNHWINVLIKLFSTADLELQTLYLLCGLSHVDTRSGCMSTLGNREIHTDPPTIYLHACTLLLGYFCIL
jgi:hypothetical protein